MLCNPAWRLGADNSVLGMYRFENGYKYGSQPVRSFQTGTALGKGACNAVECLAAPGDTFVHLVNVCVCVALCLCWMSERAKDWQMKTLWLPHFVHAYEYDSFIAVYSFSCKPAARPWNSLGSLNYYYNLLLSCWIINAQFAHIVSVKTNTCIRIRLRICSGNRFYLVQDFFEVFNFDILTGFSALRVLFLFFFFIGCAVKVADAIRR